MVWYSFQNDPTPQSWVTLHLAMIEEAQLNSVIHLFSNDTAISPLLWPTHCHFNQVSTSFFSVLSPISRKSWNNNDFTLTLGISLIIFQHIYIFSVNLCLRFTVQKSGHTTIPLQHFFGWSLHLWINTRSTLL